MDPTWPVIAEKALNKIPIDKVYEDFLQPGFQKAGEALATVIDFTNTMLFPFSWINGRRAIYLKDNLIRYQNKLNAVNDPVIEVPDMVSVPIIEKLAIITHKELSEGFINLLTKASFAKTLPLVHPSFSNILENLSPDEAKILSEIDISTAYPAFSIMIPYTRDGNSFTAMRPLRCGLEFSIKLEIPENIDLYMENLLRLKIFEFSTDKTMDDADFDKLQRQYEDEIPQTYKGCIIDKVSYNSGVMYFSEFGNTFVRACMRDIEPEI